MQYRKRPIVITAMQLTADNARDVLAWVGSFEDWSDDKRKICAAVAVQTFPLFSLSISTLEGTMRADVGDWIIRGVKGEFYPCKPDVFAETYDAVQP